MIGRFLLPTVLLAGGALLNNPLISTTVATAGGCLALADEKLKFKKINAPLVGGAILLAAASSSIRGVWNSVGTERLIYGANALVTIPLSLYRLYLSSDDFKSAFNSNHPYGRSRAAHALSILFFPALCFEMRQSLSPSFAAVGTGVATWLALNVGRSYKRYEPLAELLPIAYGTAFAYFGISQAGLFSGGSWMDKAAYAAAALLHAAPLPLYLRELQNGLAPKRATRTN